MAKTVYRVLRSVSSPTKDGKGSITLTRDNESEIGAMLSAERIAEFIDKGILRAERADGTPLAASDAPASVEGFVTAEPAPTARKGAKKE